MGSVTVLAAALRTRSRVHALILAVVGICIFSISAEARSPECPTGFANFGDSLTDTGNILDAFPYATVVENLPYGETYFGRPAKRFSNGRVVPDFFSLAFHYPLLDPYFKVTTYQYRNGINFAEGGATSIPRLTSPNPFSFVPWQLSQFRRFAASVAETQADPGNCRTFLKYSPRGSSYISNWLYTIQIGGNDLLESNLTSPEGIFYTINTTIPEVVGATALGIQQLYAGGARKFLVFGIPTTETASGEIILKTYNAQILAAIGGLRATLNGSHIAYFDYYSAYEEIASNPAKYGFDYLLPNICCGTYSGSLNFSAVTCGTPGVASCANPDQYVFWDGIHFTEAFYRQIAKFALAGNFTDGGISYTDLCKLDFSQFGPTATYQNTYPTACDSIFS